MQESPLVQYLTEKATLEARQEGIQQGKQEGIQQGEKLRALEDILDVLEVRLQPDAANAFKPELVEIDDLPSQGITSCCKPC